MINFRTNAKIILLKLCPCVGMDKHMVGRHSVLQLHFQFSVRIG